MKSETSTKGNELTRRDLLKRSAVSLAAMSAATSRLHAAGSDTIKIGLIGCGGRGTGAATQVLLSTNTSVKLWAMGDLFGDQLDRSYTMLSEGAEGRYDREAFKSLLPKMDVPKSRRFVLIRRRTACWLSLRKISSRWRSAKMAKTSVSLQS